MRLIRVVSISIVVILALCVAGCGGSSASSTSTSEYKPSVKLECMEAPCGSNQSTGEWRGYYRVRKSNFPANTEVVITAPYPNGKPYPLNQYTPLGELEGIHGNTQYTGRNGLLPEFKWAAANEDGAVDPPGLYHLTFHLKVHNHLVQVQIPMKMVRLH